MIQKYNLIKLYINLSFKFFYLFVLIALLLFIFLFSFKKKTYAAVSIDTDTSTWSTDQMVKSIALNSGYTYVAGSFTYIGPSNGKGGIVNKTTGDINTNWPIIDGTEVRVAVSDGNGGWYIGGSFTSIGGVTRNNLAHINSDYSLDTTFNPGTNGTVYTMVLVNNDLFVGGSFTTIGGVTRRFAKLNKTNGVVDTSWNLNPSNIVNSISIVGNDLYIGGNFTTVGSQTRNRLAKFNLTTGSLDATWNPNAGAQVYTVLAYGSDVYVGGTFTTVGGQTRNYIAKLNNTNGNADASWNPSASGNIQAMAILDGNLYAGGSFTTIGGQSRNRVAKINLTDGSVDSNWNPNANQSVSAINIDGNNIYIGGSFTTIGGQTYFRTVKVDNTNGNPDANWIAFTSSTIYTVVSDSNYIFIGGAINSYGGLNRNYLYRANTSTNQIDQDWNPNIATYSSGTVNEMQFLDDNLYFGGIFSTVGGQTRNYLAKVNLSDGSVDMSWNPNANNTVYTILISGTDIYVGGNFSTIGGQTRNNIAKLNSTNGNADTIWNPAANQSVLAIDISGSDIYVGGNFTTIGGQTRASLAKLNNTTGGANAAWNPNVVGGLYDVNIVDNYLYIGGQFTTISGQSISRLARVNISDGTPDLTWNPNPSAYVTVITETPDYIYIGGMFTTVAGQTINRLARFNRSDGSIDTTWIPNPNGNVNSITFLNDDMFIGGIFTTLNGVVVQNVSHVFRNPTYIQNLNINLDAFDNDKNWNIETGGFGARYNSTTVKLQNNNIITAEILTDLSISRDWSNVLSESNTGTKKTYVSSLTSAPGASSTYSIYVRKANTDYAVHFCPNVTSLDSINITCSNGYGLADINNDNISTTTINSQDYWKIDNISSDMGVMSITGFYILNLDPSIDVIKQSDGGTLQITGTGSISETESVQIVKDGYILSDLDVDMSNYRNWNNVRGDFNITQGKAVISNLNSAPGASQTHSLYVPKLAQHSSFRLCPNATNLSDVNESCSNGVDFSGPFPQTLSVGSDTVTVSLENINGQDYWKASGVSGTGGLGISPASGTPNMRIVLRDSDSIGINTDVEVWFETYTDITTNSHIYLIYDPAFSGGSSLTNSDITTYCNSNGNDPISGAVMSDVSLVTSSNGYIELNTNTDSCADWIVIDINGDNGNHLTNPNSPGNYSWAVVTDVGGDGVSDDTGATLAYVGNDNQINITTIVPPVIDFEIFEQNSDAELADPNTCYLGVLSINAINNCTYDIGTGTNSSTGISIYMTSDSGLDDEFGNDINATTGIVNAGDEEYGFYISDNGGGEYTIVGSFGTQHQQVPSAPTLIATTNSTGSGTTVGSSLQHIEITHSSSMSTDTVVGSYNQLVIYTAFTN